MHPKILQKVSKSRGEQATLSGHQLEDYILLLAYQSPQVKYMDYLYELKSVVWAALALWHFYHVD